MGLAIDGNVVHGLAVSGQSFQPLVTNEDGSLNVNGKKYVTVPRRVKVTDEQSVSIPNWTNYDALSNGYGQEPEISTGIYNCIGTGTVDGTQYYFITGSITFINGYSKSITCNIDIDESMPVGIPDWAAQPLS